jgi:hypothetical protein
MLWRSFNYVHLNINALHGSISQTTSVNVFNETAYLINMYCDLSHDYCVIEVDDHRREFCYLGDALYLHKLVYTRQNIS